MQRYVLSPDEFQCLTEIRKTVQGWDDIYNKFMDKFPECPVGKKKLQRAYAYAKRGSLDADTKVDI